MAESKALQMVIPSGEPNGIRIIKMSGWDGTCYVVPRQRLGEIAQNKEINQPGIYFLFGSDESTNDQLAYIGESNKFLNRITSHNNSKDFWDLAVIFTGELNKAHVQYLEHTAIQEAKRADRFKLTNSKETAENTLSDFDRVGTSLFFSNASFVLESFGYDIFKSIDESTASQGTYYLNGKGFNATSRLLNSGGMVVLAGSLASIKESASFGGWASAARKRYIESGELIVDGEYFRATKDIPFKSPSGAAATFAARSINGWTAWKDSAGNTLDANIRK